MNDILMTVGLIIVVGAAIALTWLQWRKATPAERSDMVAEAVQRLVEAAEQVYPQPRQGQTKFGWVMNRLAKRFPDVEWETMSEYVEQAVLHLNASKRARGAGLNGKNDA